MPQIINTNIASLTAQRNLDKSQSANQQALSRLSSGLRINSSKDDAAGLAISTRFTSQIKGLGVAIRNVGDGVSLAQTADGALGTMTDNLQRIRELSIQSANATNSDVDREALQAEVTQLVAEISRTGEQTTFNGIKLLDGEFDATFQIGANVGETVSFGISELTADSLGGGKSAGVSALGNSNALNNGDLVINGVVIGASTAADDSASTANAAASGISKAAAINKVADQTGVQATALTNIATGTAQQAATGGANSTSGTLSLNGVEIALATGDVDQAADRSSVVTAINSRSAETGVIATDSGTAQGGVTLEAADGRNISLSFSSTGSDNLSAASTGLTSNAVSEGGYTLTSTDGSAPVVVTAGTGSLSNAGLVEGSFKANTAAVNTTSRSSRAEVTSDVGNTGALAAAVTGGEVVDLSNANFSGAASTFVVEITGATSSFENGSATVTLDKDYRGGDLAAFVADINEDLSGTIAAEAYIADGDKLAFRRTSAEAGDIQLKTITVDAGLPGGDTTARAALGLEATDSLGGVTTLDSDTNVSRGGEAGRAALTSTAAVNASVTGNSDFAAADFSGVGASAQFDLVVAGATTASDNGTYTVSVDTDFTNALYSGAQADPADADRLLTELNADIANAGAGDVIEAKFNDTRTRLVFERKNAETGGSVSVDNYVASGSSSAAQSTAFGFTAGRVSTDGTANSVVGADAKAPGAADAVGGTAIGIDTDSALISGGYNTTGAGAFTAFSADSAGGLTAGSVATAGADFTAAAAAVTAGGAVASLNFENDAATVDSGDLSDALTFSGGDDLNFTLVMTGGATATVDVTTDYAGGANGGLAGLVSEIQADIDATYSGGEFLVEENGGSNGFTITTTALAGVTEEFTIANGTSNGEGATATTAVTGVATGVTNNVSFTITDGTNAAETVTLDQDYVDFTAVLTDINTNNITTNTITASEDGGTPNQLVFTETGSTGNDSIITIGAYTEASNAANLVDATTTGNAATTFTISDGTTSTDVVLDAAYTDVDGLADELNIQLAASGSLITAANGGGTLTFTSSAQGADSEVTISALSEAAATANTQNVSGFTDATASGTDGNFNLTFNVGGVDTTIDLRGAPDVGGNAYTADAGGGAVIASYINSVSGLDASFNTSTNQFTIAASDGADDLALVEGSSSALEYLGLSAGSFANTEATTGSETVAAVNLNALNEGDLKINGVTVSSSSATSDTASSSLANSSDKAASGIAIAAAINGSSNETGVSATVNATVVDGGNSSVGTVARAADGDQGTIVINGFSTNTLSLGSDSEVNRTDAIAAINKISGQTGVTATDAGDFTRLTAADGRNISVAIDNQGTSFSGENIGLSSSVDGIAEADFSVAGNSFATVAETTASTVTLTSAKEFSVSAGTNGTSGLEGLGLVAGTYGGSEDGQFLADIDISTVEGAEAAITALDNAIATVSAQRADLGAIQNRLESTVGNLTITSENLTAANSRITDADFAVETAELSRSQVLQQAGISILAQANASSQQVLSLLQ
jgi:flagellin